MRTANDHHEEGPAAPDVPARPGGDAGAAAARRDGPVDDRRWPRRRPPRPVRRLGFVYMPMGCDITRWTPPGDGHARRAVADPQPAGAGEEHVTVDHEPGAAERLSRHARHLERGVPERGAARSAPKAPTTTSARPSIRSPPSRSARTRSCRRWSWRWTCCRPSASATTATPASTRTTCRGRRRRRRCRPRPIRGWCSSAVRRGRQHGRPPGRAEEAGQPARFGDGRHRPPRATSSARPIARGSSQYLETVREVERRIQKAEARRRRQPAARSRSARRRAGRLRRPRPADVRPAGAGAAGRRHPRHHVPARARDQQPHLPRDRRARPAPPAVAPRQRPGQDRADGQDQPVPRVAVRRVPRASSQATHGRRRHAARSLALSLRQRHGQPQRPRPHQPADHRRRRRGRQA